MAFIAELNTKYMSGRCTLTDAGVYEDGSTAIRVWQDGELWATATVCLIESGQTPCPGNVFIKDWSENEGMLAALVAAKVVGEPIREIPAGHATAYECPLLVEL